MSSAVKRRKSAAKKLNSSFAVEMQRFGSHHAAKGKPKRAAIALCSSLPRLEAFCSYLADSRIAVI